MRRRKRGEEKKAMVALLLFFQDGYFGEKFLAEKNCWTQKVYLAITLSRIQQDVYHLFGFDFKYEALPGRGSHVARLNFKTSCVGVYKCFMLLSEIKQEFFVFGGILEKGDSDAL